MTNAAESTAAISDPQRELDALLAWVRECTGARVLKCERLPTVRPAWKVVTRRDGGSPETAYVLRGARPSGFGLADIYTLEREAAIVDAIGALPMPVPRVIGTHRRPDAMLLEFMQGSADFAALESDLVRKTRIIDHFIELLAVLHAATPEQLGLRGLPVPQHPRAHALGELDIWEKLYRDATGRLDPLLLFSFDWLRRNAPAADKTVLVQGDTGPNQCLFSGDRITAVLDWELAHFGDPMEDLGWIAARSFFMDFGRLKQLFARYSELSGNALNIPSIHYYRIMALVKCAIATGLARDGMAAADDIASIVSWDAVNRMALAHSLMEVLGQRLPPAESASVDVVSTERALYRLLGENFLAQAQREGSAFEQGRLRGLAQLADYLALDASQRGGRDASDAADRATLLAACGLAAGEDLQAAIVARDPRFDIPLATYFYRTECRALALLQMALGKRVQCLIEPID